MSGDLVSLRILTVCASAADRDLLRQGAAAVSIPIDVVHADNAKAAGGIIAGGDIDLVFIDPALAAPECAAVIAAARNAEPLPPFAILTAASQEQADELAVSAAADAIVVRPAWPLEAKGFVERCIRVRLPTRVLVVDDSATMRSIVRKILSASRFRLDIAEATEGVEALKQIATGKFDLAIVDYNMPGLNGIETVSEIKRQFPRLSVVMMTSTPDGAIAERARVAGATAFLKKPFYPADLDAVLYSVFGLRVPAKR